MSNPASKNTAPGGLKNPLITDRHPESRAVIPNATPPNSRQAEVGGEPHWQRAVSIIIAAIFAIFWLWGMFFAH